MAGREIIVRRVGNVLSGYLTRTSVVILSTLACRKNKKAWISFMGCGIVWSLAEMSIVLSGNRAGPMTLEGNLRYVGALLRGFSEGAAVAGCAIVPDSIWTLMAAVLILFDAAVVYDGATEVSKRVVSNPRAMLFVIGFSFLWVAWYPRKGAYPASAMWRMSIFGFLWNVFAMLSGARIVYPTEASLFFAAYDGLFEIGLLYAALSQIALVVCSSYLDPEEEEVEEKRERRPSLVGAECGDRARRTLSDEEGGGTAAVRLQLLADTVDKSMERGNFSGLDFSEAYRVVHSSLKTQELTN